MLEEALALAELKKNDPWDIIVVGDGSGSRWGYGGGWATILFDKFTGLHKVQWGALSDTTINICELSPYIYSVLWHHRCVANMIRKQKKQAGQMFPVIETHIITDCEIIAKQGRGEMKRELNSPLWASFIAFERLGFNFHFHWINRDSGLANQVCDMLSKQMRHIIEGVNYRIDQELPSIESAVSAEQVEALIEESTELKLSE